MTTRRDIFLTIAAAVEIALPEPQEMTFDPATVWLRFDNTDDARLWARWHSPECLASFYTGGPLEEPPSHYYYGERSDWKWSIVGRDRSLTPQEQEATDVDEPAIVRLVAERSTEPTFTREQVTMAILSPDSLVVPCPRCGHSEHVHEDEDPGSARCCLDCAGFCSPVVLVPAGVEGWSVGGRAQ